MINDGREKWRTQKGQDFCFQEGGLYILISPAKYN